MLLKAKVSVIMAVYNTPFHITKRAIDSVLKQSFQDFNLIIVDDGSDNEHYNRLINYAHKHNDKIIYLRHENRGQAESVNIGILQSKSKYITILDSDDEYEQHHLQGCLNEMPFADLIASTTKTIVEKEEDYYVPDKYDRTKSVHVDDCILFATLFGKREIFTSLKFQDVYAADAHFYEKAADIYKVNKVNLRSYIYYRNNPNSICGKMKKENFALIA